MDNEQKLQEIQNLCVEIMQKWSHKSSYNDPYEDGKVVGRSILAETILDIIQLNG